MNKEENSNNDISNLSNPHSRVLLIHSHHPMFMDKNDGMFDEKCRGMYLVNYLDVNNDIILVSKPSKGYIELSLKRFQRITQVEMDFFIYFN